VLALILGQHVFNLAELAESIRADRMLSHLVTEAACLEFGWSWLSIEQAIVLLGSRRLCSLLSRRHGNGRSASRFRCALHVSNITTAANLGLLEKSQEKPE